MVCSVPAVAFAQSNVSSQKSNSYSDSVVVDGDNIVYTCYSLGNIDYIQFNDPKLGEMIIEKDNFSGIVTMNGKYVATAGTTNLINSLPQQYDSDISSYATRTWKLYNTRYSNLVSDVISKATWIGIIAALLGAPISTPIIAQIAQQLVVDNAGIVYYKEEQFYIDPVSTQRPVTQSKYTFYKNSNYTKTIGTYDGRYKL